MTRTNYAVGLIAALPLLMGAKGQGCGGGFASQTAAPDAEGTWAVAYEPMMDVTITLGGSVYKQSLPGAGGEVVFTHQGKPYSFDVACDKPEIICPSEVWPTSVALDQRDPMYPHHVWATIPTQSCSGKLVAPAKADCGAGTENPDCTPVCTGTVTTTSKEAFGVIDEPGRNFTLLLGGTVATNGVNCGLLGISAVQAKLTTAGAAATGDWEATAMAGAVKAGYAGGCLWAGDVNMDGKAEAIVVGATLELSVPFTATRR